MAAKTSATLIVAREEKIRYTQNYTKLDKTTELTRDITQEIWANAHETRDSISLISAKIHS